jgi:DNA-binding transcriptional ArsR family regulator
MNHGVPQGFDLVELKGASGAGAPDAHTVEVATLDIGRKAVFAVVGSPLRMRIFEIIRRSGECSVRELSLHSQLSTTGLYYHLQALEHLDLIRQVGVRKGDARRAPAVFSATCDRIRILFNPDDSTQRSRMATIRRRWHEESMRSVDESLELVRDSKSPQVRTRLEWEALTRDEIEHISELFGQIEEICHRARARGSVVPDDARPVHVALQLCELGSPVMPTPMLLPEVNRRAGALGDLVDRIDSARNRQRTATA